jgi:catechol 2,3-dioxygenase-like lactoylglutathione lyase family enzyme
LNHVAISVPNLDEAVTYYTKIMGFPEAFRNLDETGQPTLVYVQISKGTFVELQPANAQRPPGLNHLGLHVENMAAATAIFKRRGANVSETRVSPASVRRKPFFRTSPTRTASGSSSPSFLLSRCTGKQWSAGSKTSRADSGERR